MSRLTMATSLLQPRERFARGVLVELVDQVVQLVFDGHAVLGPGC
jgi:hypothetical protein